MVSMVKMRLLQMMVVRSGIGRGRTLLGRRLHQGQFMNGPLEGQLMMLQVLLQPAVRLMRSRAVVSRRRIRGRRTSMVYALHFNVKRDFVLGFDDLGEGNETIDEFLSQDLLDNVLVVIITQRSTQFVVVHVVFVLSQTPQPGHFFGVNQLEFAISVRPSNDVRVLVT